MPSDATRPAGGEVRATMASTRGIAFAIWWRLCLVWIAVSLAAGFVSSVLPAGQIEFWVARLVAGLFGDGAVAAGQFDMAIAVSVNMLAAAVLFVVLNWIVAGRIGRNFGRFRLALERVE